MTTLPTFAIVAAAGAAAAAPAPRWKKIDLNPAAPFEAVGVADLDGDGRVDIFSGDSWYRAPRWVRHKVREVPPQARNPHYHEDFANVPLDVNGDGNTDFITCVYASRFVAWIEHPGDPSRPWRMHEIDRPGPSETCRVVDINGDGRADVLPNSVQALVWYELVAQKPEVKWRKHVVDATRDGAGHGVGAGDINGDGRIDLVVPKGWHEQPADAAQPWRFHRELDLGRQASIEILVRDVDGDGLADLVWGASHDRGLFWLRQAKGGDGARTWTKHDIDSGIPLAHTLLWADLDGRGSPAVVTGTRVYAHEKDPGATDAPGIYAYRYDRKRGRWSKEVIYQGWAAANAPPDDNERHALKDFPRGTAGTGLDMAAVDIDGDGDLDLVCPGKSGLYLFENPRPRPKTAAVSPIAK